MLSGALPLDVLGVDSWPVGVPAQIRYTVDDPFRRQEDIDALVFKIQASGSPVDCSTMATPGTRSLTRRCRPNTTLKPPGSGGTGRGVLQTTSS
jgi:hypothetical protein